MKNRVSYYVSRRNPLVWLAALCMLASAVLRIWNAAGAGLRAAEVWLLVVLPVLCCLHYIIILLLRGDEWFFRTAIPAVALAIYYGLKVTMHPLGVHLTFVFWIAYLAIAAFYAVTVSGKIRATFPAAVLLAASACVLCYVNRQSLRSGQGLLAVLPDVLFLMGGFFGLIAAHVRLDNRYHPTWGDRSDGRKLRTLDPMQIVGNYIMPTRNESSNCIQDAVEITNLERYVREKRKAGLSGFGFTHVFLAAYVRIIARYPGINRFLSGQQVFSRDDDIQFCMTIKTEMKTDAAESIFKLHLKPTDTPDIIYEKFQAGVESIKGQEIGGSDFDKTAKALSLIPGVAFKFVVWLLRVIDYFGFLPKFLLEVSPFHATVFFTSMGSLGIPAIVHHLYDFGNMPVFCAFGCKRHANELQEDGSVVRRKYIDFSVNTDERIVDGFYFATALKYLKKLLAHPEVLDTPPEVVNRDID